MANVFLKRKRKKRLELGHPWVFQSEVDYIEGTLNQVISSTYITINVIF
ncbi:hypothetical protein LR68_02528 [Anoxybacillus sp. BCO1]|nr:hypothetical protein LR68_02528 [Anoxybacillus sp. BCO1]